MNDELLHHLKQLEKAEYERDCYRARLNALEAAVEKMMPLAKLDQFVADVKAELLKSGSFTEQIAAPDRVLQRWREQERR